MKETLIIRKTTVVPREQPDVVVPSLEFLVTWNLNKFVNEQIFVQVASD